MGTMLSIFMYYVGEYQQSLGTGYYIFVGILLLFGIIGFISLIYKMSNNSKKELLDKMFENDDITVDVYKKYKKEI